MITGADDEQVRAEYRRLLNHEMFGLNVALIRGEQEAAELKMKAVKRYMTKMTAMEWFAAEVVA